MLTELVPVVVAAAAGTPLAAVVGWVVSRKQRSANYAQIVSDMSAQFAEKVNQKNVSLEQKVDVLQSAVDTLRLRVVELTDTLQTAITRLDEHGANTDPLREVLHRRTNGVG